MTGLSFRAKLILAMTLIVAGVTGATLAVTQRRVQDTYQKLFEEQFQTQISFFSESRMRQLDAVARRCEEVAKSVRVVAALADEDSRVRVYQDIITLLPEYFIPQEQPGPPDAPAAGGGLMPDPLAGIRDLEAFRKRANAGASNSPTRPIIRVMDADGNFLNTNDPRMGLFKQGRLEKSAPPGTRRPEQIHGLLNLVSQPKNALTEQEFGYIELGISGGKSLLHEIIVTPVTDHESGKYLGALLIALPVSDFGGRTPGDGTGNELLSGIWLDGKIFSSTIPPAVRDVVGATVSARMHDQQDYSSMKPVLVDGVAHRIFFKLLNRDSPFPAAAQVCLYSLKDSLAEQDRLRGQILGFGGTALLASIGVILFISHGFSQPIEQLALATRRIREGDFSVNVPVKSRDEIGALTASFNEMSVELALKERYKAVLAQVTDKEVAEQLISGRMSLGGEVRQAGVLFCDIRGFSALTENMPPAEVIILLNEHMTAMNRIVHRHHGIVDKFVGDLIMAVFGAPKSYGNDALQAVTCALDMIVERGLLNTRSRHQFEIGIGVASGEVVAGCMGSEDRLNYTVVGERVNLASRLCAKAGGMELLIDENTCAQLPPTFLVEPTEPMTLKGFSAPIPAYLLKAPAAEAARPAPTTT